MIRSNLLHFLRARGFFAPFQNGSLVVAAIVLSFVVTPGFAALIVYEPFDYTANTRVLGQANPSTGTPWRLAAQSGTTDTTAINVASGNLTTPPILAPAVGNSATINGNGNLSGAANRLAFNSSSTGFAADSGNTIYYSLLLRGDALTGSNNTIGGFLIGLNNTGDTATTANPSAVAARIQARVDPTDATKYDLGIFRNVAATTGATSWSAPLDLSTTHFIVASIEQVAGAGNDIARIWIDPDPSTFGSPTVPAATRTDNTTGGTDIGALSIILRQSPAPFFTLDEIRVGTAWGDVTAPEPTSISLVCLCIAIGMLGRRRL
jgi:hypothetical protein